MVWADYRRYTRAYGADIDIAAFARLVSERLQGHATPWPKAMADAFKQANTPAEREVQALLEQWAANEANKLQEGLFAQKKRLADAQRVLAGPKPTKKASEDQRIATNKIEQAMACWRRLNIDPHCRFNIDPGRVADFGVSNCG